MTSSNDSKFTEPYFEAFFKEHFKAACSYCQYKYGFDIDTAKEIAHISFIRLWKKRAEIKAELSVEGYFYKILINSTIDYHKHQRVKQLHETYVLKNYSQNEQSSTLNEPDFRQLSSDIENAVAELPEMMGLIFRLNRYEGMKYREIAKKLGISVKTVETQMSRALAKLRTKLSHYLHLYFVLIILGM